MTSQNTFLDPKKIFNFDFNYILQRDMPGIGLAVNQEGMTAEHLPTNIPILQNQLNIFDFSPNNPGQGLCEKLSKILTQSNIAHIILCPDPHVKSDRIFYLPTFYLYGLDTWQSSYQKVFDHKKLYNISCLNKNNHSHRIENYVRLLEKDYGPALISWADYSGATNPPATPESMKKYYALKAKGFTPSRDVTNFQKCHSILDDAYQASYVNIVTETIMNNDVCFITEKTWKPIASGQIFFMVGCKGTMAYLKSVGVDTFDDIIDHSYDSESDWVKRIDLMHKSLDKLMELDLAEVYEQTKDRRKQNQELFFSGKFGMQYVDQINDAAKKYNIA
jgi:hypothetical protein